MILLNVTRHEWQGGKTAFPATVPERAEGFDLRQAIALNREQQAALVHVRALLQRLLLLAQQAPTLNPVGAAAGENDFRQMAAQIRALADRDVDQVRLLDGATLAIDVEPEGNKLILGGADLHARPYRDALAASIDRPASAARAGRLLESALERLAMDESIVRANWERLQFYLSQSVPMPARLDVTSVPDGSGSSAWPDGCSFPPLVEPPSLRTASG